MMTRLPKISVIIPVYGVEGYLRECLDSAINQTLSDIEIIVIDDGSKDSCPEIIDEYAQKDSRIIAVHKSNSGYGHTCNTGLDMAQGEYIAILEPDDYISLNMYENLYKIAQKNNSDIVKCGFYNVLKEVSFKEKWDDNNIPKESFTINDCPSFLYYHPSIWSCIYKHEFISTHNIRFVEAPGAGWSDNPFQVQTMCLAERINYTPIPYYYWRRSNIDASKQLKDYTIPFKRMDEIYFWVKESHNDSKKILTALYKREFIYMRIVLGMENFADFRDMLRRIKQTCRRMNLFWVLHSNQYTSNDKITCVLGRIFPILVYINKNRLKKLRKNIISVRLNRNETSIVVFNKCLVKNIRQKSPSN